MSGLTDLMSVQHDNPFHDCEQHETVFYAKDRKGEITPEDIMISGYLDTKRNIAEAGLAWSADYISHGLEPLRNYKSFGYTYGSAQVTGSNDYKD